MANKREVEIDLIANDKASGPAGKVGDAVRRVGDELKETSKAADKAGDALSEVDDAAGDAASGLKIMSADTGRLDEKIRQAEASIRDLAVAIATSDIDDKGLFADLRKQQGELRKLTKIKDLLPDLSDGIKVGTELGVGMARSTLTGFITQAPKLFAAGGPASGVVTAALVGVGAAAGMLAGAAVAGGIVVGLAGGVIALGVKSALADVDVAAHGESMAREMGEGFGQATSAFKIPVSQAITDIKLSFRRMLPDIKGAFSVAATYVEPLTSAITTMAEDLIPAIRRAVVAAAPVITGLAEGLEYIGSAVADGLDSLSDNGREMGAAMTVVMKLVGMAVNTTFFTINMLTEAFGWAMTAALKLFTTLARIGEGMQYLPGPVGELGKGLAALAGPMDEAQAKWDQFAAQGKAGVEGLKGSTSGLDLQQRLLNGTMGEGIELAGSLSKAFDELNGTTRTARQAESDYQAAIDGVSSSIKENGRTLDLHTEKGRANDAAVRTLIDSVKAKADAVYNETLATKGVAAAEAAAGKVYETGRQQLIKNLTQILGNKEAARLMADQIMKIPKNWSTNVAITNAEKAKAQAKAIKDVVNGIRSKNITIGVWYKSNGDLKLPGGTSLKGASTGGYIDGPGTSTSDSIPMRLSRGEYVVRAAAVARPGVRQMLERLNGLGGDVAAGGVTPGGARVSSGGGGQVRVVFDFLGIDSQLARALRNMVRVEGGGNVQVAFGGK